MSGAAAPSSGVGHGGTARLALTTPLRGLRLHDLRRAEAEGPSPRLVALLNLRVRQEREAERHEVLVRAAKALESALLRVPEQVERKLREVADLAVELGLAVAREVVGNSLDAGIVDPAPLVARCLRAAVAGGERATLTVTLHPSDLASVLNAVELDPELRLRAQQCSFEADSQLAPGVVRVASDAGRLLYDPREVLERMAAEIRKAPPA